ncbi:MAG: hypothetical protein KDA69_19290 [Planctomycetaceae bacterium]|nr:hypothetical protein [Planctomycetaceae bacterium]
MKSKTLFLAVVGLAMVLMSCHGPVVEESTTTGTDDGTHAVPMIASIPATNMTPEKLVSEHLPNPVRIHERVISGGLPEGEAAFQELADMGVKTIISVDGMTPDVETAQRHGLRYVHLPHGYDGIPQQRIKELAKAVRELEGPIYIHCHHGKHRSPAAASVACVSAGLIPSDQALPILELAGTNPNYLGLYKAAREAHEFDAALLDELNVEFKEVQEIPPMAAAMVQLSHAHDHLKMVADAGWKAPPDHPDLTAAHEALLNQELYTEMLRTEEVSAKPDDFRSWLADSETATKELQAELGKWSSDDSIPPERLSELLTRVSANCKACHVKYRDVPLSESTE